MCRSPLRGIGVYSVLLPGFGFSSWILHGIRLVDIIRLIEQKFLRQNAIHTCCSLCSSCCGQLPNLPTIFPPFETIMKFCMNIQVTNAHKLPQPDQECVPVSIFSTVRVYPASVAQRQSVGLEIERSRVRNSLEPPGFSLGLHYIGVCYTEVYYIGVRYIVVRYIVVRYIGFVLHRIVILWVIIMEGVAAAAHLPTPWLFEPVERPDDSADS